MELNRWTVLLPKRSVQTVEVERFVCKCACRSLPSSSTDVEVYPVHLFNLCGPKIVSLGHLIKIINLTTFPTLRVRSACSCLVSRRFLGFSAVVAAPWVTGRTKNKKRRIPFHVKSSLVTLCFWSFPWSLRRDYCLNSEKAPVYKAGSGENESLVEKSEANRPCFLLFFAFFDVNVWCLQ